jgi:hypothetical protein
MPYILGESINLGVGPETVRGTALPPTAWIPARTPTGVNQVMDKILLKETRNSKAMSQDSIISAKRVEGDLEFNVRNRSVGWLFYSLFGDVAASLVGGETAVWDHLFSILPENPQHPSLSLALSQPGQQDYEYNLALVRSVELRTPVDDLVNATASFLASAETAHADYAPVFAATDYLFRHYDVTIKLADTLAELEAADAVGVKEFAILLNNNARPNMVVSDLNPSDVIAQLFEITGDVTFDKLDETYRDIWNDGTRKAMRISMTRSDITIGNAANPAIVIDLPAVTFEAFDPDRPIDDIVREKFSFVAHHDDTAGSQGTVTVTSDVEDYTAVAGS